MFLAGSLFVDIAGLELNSEDKEILQHPLVGGITLFTRNYASPEQLQTLTADIHALKPNLIIAVDHEGGRVQRFREGFTIIPAASEFGELYDHNRKQALYLTQQAAWLMASELLSCGVDLSYAPVLDLQNLESRVIGKRAFHADPEKVTLLAESFIVGMHQAGMAAIGKHFPGHGTVLADSHVEDPIDDRCFHDISTNDLLPFVKLATQLEGMMPAHVIYSAVDPEPASFSSHWLKTVLREQIKFTGLVFSDDLTMQAAAKIGDYPARFRTAIAAGCDIGLVCNNRDGVIQILDDVKDISTQVNSFQVLRGKRMSERKELLQSPIRNKVVSDLKIGRKDVSHEI